MSEHPDIIGAEPAAIGRLLAAVADRAAPGAPPVALLRRRARRRRRARGLGVAVAVAVASALAVPGIALLASDGEDALVANPADDAADDRVTPRVEPTLQQLRPEPPPPDLVVEGDPISSAVTLREVGDARTDPVDPSLLVLTIPAGNGIAQVGEPCWGGARGSARVDDGTVHLELLSLGPDVPLPPDGACPASQGFAQIVVDLGEPLAGRPVVLTDGRRLDVADGGLLPVSSAVPEPLRFAASSDTGVRYEDPTDRRVAADLRVGGFAGAGGTSAHPHVARFEVAPGEEAVVGQYAERGFQVTWSDDRGLLSADVAELPLADVEALVRGVVRADVAYGAEAPAPSGDSQDDSVPAAGRAAPGIQPPLEALRPAFSPPAGLVREAGSSDLRSAGVKARTDPLDQRLLVVTVPGAAYADADARDQCWSSVRLRAVEESEAVRLAATALRSADVPDSGPGGFSVCRGPRRVTDVSVVLSAPLAGRSLLRPDGAQVPVEDGRLLPVLATPPADLRLDAAESASTIWRSGTRTALLTTRTGRQPDTADLPVVERLPLLGAGSDVTATIARLPDGRWRAQWDDGRGPLLAEADGLTLGEMRELVRSVVRAGDAYQPWVP